MTLGTRTRLREAIRQVADEKLRQYIEACIAIHGNRTSSATAQRRELKAAAEQIAQEAGTPAPRWSTWSRPTRNCARGSCAT